MVLIIAARACVALCQRIRSRSKLSARVLAHRYGIRITESENGLARTKRCQYVFDGKCHLNCLPYQLYVVFIWRECEAVRHVIQSKPIIRTAYRLRYTDTVSATHIQACACAQTLIRTIFIRNNSLNHILLQVWFIHLVTIHCISCSF